MDVVTPLIANREPAVLRKPGQCALHYPPMPSQLLAALYALCCYTAFYPAPSQGSLALLVIVGLVGVKLVGTLPWSATGTLDGFYRVDELFENHRVVDVCRADHHTQSGMPLRSETTWRFVPAFPLSVGFLPTLLPPFWPGWKPSLNRRVPTLFGQLRQGDPRAPGAAAPRLLLPPATHASAAST
jgi:hypothetical protein